MLSVRNIHLDLFRRDLYKDVRKLEATPRDDPSRLRRYSDGVTALAEELSIIEALQKRLRWLRLPAVLGTHEEYVEFQYIKGIRAFNLLIALRDIYTEDGNRRARELGEGILRLLNEHLDEFQTVFATGGLARTVERYPFRRKCTQGIHLLASVLGDQATEGSIQRSLEPIIAAVEPHSSVPFRDLNPKNVIVGIPSLFGKEFRRHSDRLARVRSMLSSGSLCVESVKDSIFHCDFSGCKYLCPPWDDRIALNIHESAVWLGEVAENYLERIPDGMLIPMGMLRFIRLGCRKLAYRLLHHEAYKVRYVFEDEGHYFRYLQKWTAELVAAGTIAREPLVRLSALFAQACSLQPTEDYFEKRFRCSHDYYSDIFPY